MIKEKRKKRTLIELAALHEAAHAVVYYIHGYKVDYIKCDENGNGFTGHIDYVLPTHFSSDPRPLEERINIFGLICMAGYFAELKANRKSLNIFDLGDIFYHSNIDDFEALKLQMYLANMIEKNEKYDFDFFCSIAKKTKKTLSNQKLWEAIQELSNALLANVEHCLHYVGIINILDKYDFKKKEKN